jgi:hypothetical protein
LIEGLSAEEERAAIQAARDSCWERGDLGFLLDDNQEQMYEEIKNAATSYFVLECARRLGKSYLLCCLAIEQCLTKPKSRVLYAAPTTKDAVEIVSPLIEEICESAPFRVKFSRQQGKFLFPNGSQIRLFGCDNKAKANRGRGTGAHLVLIDEAGFVPVLDHVLHSVVAPQTLTTGGRVVLASTPSDEPDHPFTTIATEAEAGGYYLRRTIFDNPRLTEDRIKEYIREDAAIHGMSVIEFQESDVYKREHLALRVIDTNLVVVPKWHSGLMEALPRPQFYDGYQSLDMGGVDPHACLFGYWDYVAQHLVIEDELLLRDGQNTQELADAIKAKETELWGNKGWDGTLRGAREQENLPEWLKGATFASGNTQPYLRVCDNDVQIAKDLMQLHKLAFIPTAKDNKWFQVNAVNVMLSEGRIKIHPRCKNLDRHLRTTMWQNEKNNNFRRRKGEHGDLLDCLVYLVRNLRKSKDPRPLHYGVSSDNVWIRPDPKKKITSLLPWWSDKL